MTAVTANTRDETIDHARRLQSKFRAADATVAVIGMGYVGLPLASTFLRRGFRVAGFDVDQHKVGQLNAGRSTLSNEPLDLLRETIDAGRFVAQSDFSGLAAADAILICVPTPLLVHREPDLSYVIDSTKMIAKYLRPGQLVVLESTTYPGTTEEELCPILEASGLQAGVDFFLAYSPEREDPGNPDFSTGSIPKVVAGYTGVDRDVACALYGEAIEHIVPVPSCRTAEAVKLTENIFRSVNIALVNELKVIFEKMDVNVWDVIDAAKTKPFGYMPFFPGPGLGGHCIPIDPFYLSWKAREFDLTTRFIELAGEINTAMPAYVVDTLIQALNDRFAKSIKSARILLIGAAYKKNVADMRESPALKLIEMLELRGAAVDYYDPHVPELPASRSYPSLTGRASIAWSAEGIAGYDAALICTDHDAIDYALLGRSVPLVVDTRNAMARHGIDSKNVVLS